MKSILSMKFLLILQETFLNTRQGPVLQPWQGQKHLLIFILPKNCTTDTTTEQDFNWTLHTRSFTQPFCNHLIPLTQRVRETDFPEAMIIILKALEMFF